MIQVVWPEASNDNVSMNHPPLNASMNMHPGSANGLNKSCNDRLVALCGYKATNDRLLKSLQFIMQTVLIGNWEILI